MIDRNPNNKTEVTRLYDANHVINMVDYMDENGATTHEILDYLFNIVEEYFVIRPDIEESKKLLNEFNIEKNHISVSLAIMSIVVPLGKDIYEEHKSFGERLKKHIRNICDPEYADRLISGTIWEIKYWLQ